MKISVILCTYNREKYLTAVLDSIVKQTLSPIEYEVLLINNNSPGNTKSIAQNFKNNHPEINFRYFEELNQGLSFARNRGINECNYELITFIDDDAFLKEDFLQNTVEVFKKSENTIAIGGQILLSYEGKIPSWENKYLNSLLGYFKPSNSTFIFSTKNYPRGSNMTFRKKIFNEIGMFNVKLGRIGGQMIGGEEKEIFNRIYQLKKYNVLYIPSVIVYHTVPESRTTKEFIISQARGNGLSEKIRTQEKGLMSYLKRVLDEIFKWGVSILIAFYYLLKLKSDKGKMLIRFRYWCTRGLIG